MAQPPASWTSAMFCADAVVGLELEAPPVGPHARADVVGDEQVADLVGLDRVVERRDLEAELLRDVDHRRHLVGAVAVVLDPDLAVEHAHQRLELQVAIGRLAGSAPSLFHLRQLLAVLDRRLPGLAVAGDVAHPGRRRGRPCCRRRASGSRRRPSSGRRARRETSSRPRCARGTFLTVTLRPPNRFAEPGRICIVVTPPASASSNCGSCGQMACSDETSAVFGLVISLPSCSDSMPGAA